MTGRLTKAKQVVLVGLMSAILLMVQVVLSGLPNVELISLLVTLFSLHFGPLTLLIIYVFVLVEGLLYGFGMWWFSYLYIWTILYVVARLCRRSQSAVVWAAVNGVFGLLFGAMTALPYLIVSGPAGAFSYFIAGIPFDITHCIANFLAALLLFHPLNRLLGKATNQYL